MGLFKRYQRFQCENAIKAYTILGKVLASEYVYVAARTLKDSRAHDAIRKLVYGQRSFSFTPSGIEHNGELFQQYMTEWMEVWNEHTTDFEAWHADPDMAVNEDEINIAESPLGAEAWVTFGP